MGVCSPLDEPVQAQAPEVVSHLPRGVVGRALAQQLRHGGA
jgi:hypothetical protein